MSGQRPQGVTIGRLAALVAIVVICTVIVAVLVPRFAADSGDGAEGRNAQGPTLRGPAYAYITPTRFVLMRGGRPAAEVSRVFDLADPQHNKVAWTYDGRYVVFLSDDAFLDRPEDTRLIAVNAATGQVRRLSCAHCYDLAPVGEGDVLALMGSAGEEGAGMLRFAMDGAHSARTEPSPFTGNGSTWLPGLLAGTPTRVLTAQYAITSSGGTAMNLRLVDADGGGEVSFPLFESNAYMPAAAARTHGQEHIAVAARTNPGACPAPFPISLLNSQGKATATDMTAALPPGFVPGVTGGVEVNDLWWAFDGHLYATITSWTCDDSERAANDTRVLHHPSSLWRLDGGKWVSAGSDSATMLRRLDDHTTVLLRIPDCIGPATHDDSQAHCHSGVLYQEHDGTRTTVAKGVLAIVAPPTNT
ncbi:hypothetical protein ACFV3E_34765 [Streptomyces sp. NPDC059718]